MKPIKSALVSILMLGVLSASLFTLTACGSAGGRGTETVFSKSKKLLGKVYAKLIGDKIGYIKAQVKELTSDVVAMEGTVEIDGHTFPFKTVVGADNRFTVYLDESVSNSVIASIQVTGTLEPGSFTITSGDWDAKLPASNGVKGSTTRYKGSVESSTGNGVVPVKTKPVTFPDKRAAPKKDEAGAIQGGCEWDPRALYFKGAVVRFKNKTYTLKSEVEYGLNMPEFINPGTGQWIKGGKCGPPPQLTITDAQCIISNGSATVTITGRATVNGYGPSIVAFADRRNSGEATTSHSFGIVDKGYTMDCPGWGKFNSQLKGNNYGICKRYEGQPETVRFSSKYTLSGNAGGFIEFAYLSMGVPLIENPQSIVGIPGSIIQGLGVQRIQVPLACK